MEGLAEKFPELTLTVIDPLSEESTGESRGNLREIGRQVRMDALYGQCAVLVRITSHHGLPRMVLEAMAHGLDVISSTRMPSVPYAESLDQAIVCMNDMLRAGPVPNRECAACVLKESNECASTRRLVSLYRQLLCR